MKSQSKFPTVFHAQANALLLEIGEVTRAHKTEEAKAAVELEALRQKWAPSLKEHQEYLADLKKQLLALMRKAKTDLFPERSEPGSDRVDLPSGALIHSLAAKLRKAKCVTPEVLEELGFPEAVRIVKSVDWDRLEGWPDARLVLIGTERKPVEEFAWEVKG